MTGFHILVDTESSYLSLLIYLTIVQLYRYGNISC